VFITSWVCPVNIRIPNDLTIPLMFIIKPLLVFVQEEEEELGMATYRASQPKILSKEMEGKIQMWLGNCILEPFRGHRHKCSLAFLGAITSLAMMREEAQERTSTIVSTFHYINGLALIPYKCIHEHFLIGLTNVNCNLAKSSHVVLQRLTTLLLNVKQVSYFGRFYFIHRKLSKEQTR